MARAGNFRDQVTFELLPGDAVDDYGNPADVWVEIATVMADIRERPGRESFASGRPESTRTATLRVRTEPAMQAMTSADRVVARGATWDILSGPIQVDRTGQVLEFILETGAAV